MIATDSRPALRYGSVLSQRRPPRRKFLCGGRPWLRYRTIWLVVALFLVAALPLSIRAQGCTQCLDSTRATPPQVQAAYRHAIYLLGGTAVLLFVAGGLLLRHKR